MGIRCFYRKYLSFNKKITFYFTILTLGEVAVKDYRNFTKILLFIPR